MADIHTTGPVGTVIADIGIETYIKNMAAKWDASVAPSSWWQFWKKVSFISITNFLLAGLDDLVSYVDGLIENNVDKKATVINAVSRLYDGVIFQAMPIWLKPFSPMIRNIVIGQIIPAAIDFIVSKYRSGSWAQKDPVVVAQMFGVPGDHRPS